jgi:hypothetical protein
MTELYLKCSDISDALIKKNKIEKDYYTEDPLLVSCTGNGVYLRGKVLEPKNPQNDLFDHLDL